MRTIFMTHRGVDLIVGCEVDRDGIVEEIFVEVATSKKPQDIYELLDKKVVDYLFECMQAEVSNGR